MLDAFARVYDALDEIITMIRRSGARLTPKRSSSSASSSTDQAEAIRELKLYKLAGWKARDPGDSERAGRAAKKEARRLENLLASDAKRWDVIRRELGELREKYADKRRTRIGVPAESDRR